MPTVCPVCGEDIDPPDTPEDIRVGIHNLGCPLAPPRVVDLDALMEPPAPPRYPAHAECEHRQTITAVRKCERRNRPVPELAHLHRRCEHPMTAYQVRRCNQRRMSRGFRGVPPSWVMPKAERAKRSHARCDHPDTPAGRTACRRKRNNETGQ